MKKGFTLIELLAVIAILSIIMIIATPRVLDVIENSRISAYQQDEQMMVKATKTYLGNNADQLPENIGDTVEVTLNTLKINEFIGEVNDQSGDCNGYILVTKTNKGYSYNPQLKCGTSNTITSSIDDALVSYYKFDNNFYDSSTNEYHATAYGTNSNWFETDRYGNEDSAVNFHNSTHNYLRAPLHNIDTELSICIWIYPKSYQLAELRTIVQGINPSSFYLSMGTNGRSATYWYGTTPSGYHMTSNTMFPLNTWTHVCTVWDGSYNYHYVNGKEVLKKAVTGLGDNGTLLNVGAESIARQFEGMMDDLEIYERALNAEEIEFKYNINK